MLSEQNLKCLNHLVHDCIQLQDRFELVFLQQVQEVDQLQLQMLL